MKKKVLLLLVSMLALTVTACTQDSSAQQEVVGPVAETTVEESVSETAEEEVLGIGDIQGETAEVEGMVVDAAMNSIAIQTLSGEIQMFSYPDGGVTTEKEGEILLGEVVKVIYSGTVEAGDAMEAGGAMALKIEEGSVETTLPREAYEFALTAVNLAKFNDLEGLSGIVTYPVYIGISGTESVTVKNAEDFVKLDREALMPLGVLADFNLFNMTESKAGFVIGDTKPNMIFAKTENGYGITGINIE